MARLHEWQTKRAQQQRQAARGGGGGGGGGSSGSSGGGGDDAEALVAAAAAAVAVCDQALRQVAAARLSPAILLCRGRALLLSGEAGDAAAPLHACVALLQAQAEAGAPQDHVFPGYHPQIGAPQGRDVHTPEGAAVAVMAAVGLEGRSEGGSEGGSEG